MTVVLLSQTGITLSHACATVFWNLPFEGHRSQGICWLGFRGTKSHWTLKQERLDICLLLCSLHGCSRWKLKTTKGFETTFVRNTIGLSKTTVDDAHKAAVSGHAKPAISAATNTPTDSARPHALSEIKSKQWLRPCTYLCSEVRILSGRFSFLLFQNSVHTTNILPTPLSAKSVVMSKFTQACMQNTETKARYLQWCLTVLCSVACPVLDASVGRVRAHCRSACGSYIVFVTNCWGKKWQDASTCRKSLDAFFLVVKLRGFSFQ